MNRIVLPALLLAVLLVTAPGVSSSVGEREKPPSYALRCRGTKDLKVTIVLAVVFATYEFKKGTRKADAGLAPGECSWLDRGMRDGESDTLMQSNSPTPSVFTAPALNWHWTEALKDPENYWTFSVYLDAGTGLLIVTDSKPYTKMTVNPSAPTLEAVIPRVGADPAAGNRAEAVRPSTLEPDTNRPGQDYKSLELTDPQPEVCQQACADDPKCRSFTYVKPGGQGPRAVCWLKSGVPAASKSDCCVSGVKPATRSSAARPARP